MSKACGSCGRPPVLQGSRKCAYCGGPVVDEPQPEARLGEAAPAPPASPAVPPIQPMRARGSRSASATQVAPAAAAAPSSATATAIAVGADLPFPEAQAAPPGPRPTRAAGGRPAGAPRVLPVETEPELPAWQRVLLAPFASKGRLMACGVAAFVAIGVWALSSFIEAHKPKDNPAGKLVLYPPSPDGAPTGYPGAGPDPRGYPGGYPGAEAGPMRQSRATKARESLSAIGSALRVYAERYNSFPTELSDDLRELGPPSELAPLLASFEGGRLAAYRRTMSSDFSLDRVVIEAKVMGSGEAITEDLTYYRRKVELPPPPPREPAAYERPAQEPPASQSRRGR